MKERAGHNAGTAIVVCGPTASGKSGLSDTIAEKLSERSELCVPTIAVDSMQVYRELPVITNQQRDRHAEMVGVVSVTQEWTVARHREETRHIVSDLKTPFVLDAGTGMYLNAILLDIPLAPKVPEETRREAQRIASGTPNQRRAAREAELDMVGAPERGSIWDGNLIYDTAMIYLRPTRQTLDANIARRSRKIAAEGNAEALALKELEEQGLRINPSVRNSIGVKELRSLIEGELTTPGAETLINTRTRQLARRQMRWFDKLARKLQGKASRIIVAKGPDDPSLRNFLHTMHGTMRLW